MKYQRHSFKQIHKIFSALFIIFTFFIQVMPKTVHAFRSSSPVSETIKRADDFDKDFRQARDLIDDEQWAKAAEKFSEIVGRYPDNKSVDAALYWLAFCHKKQKNFKEANVALDRLIAKFPASSWASDARVMKMEIAYPEFSKPFPAFGTPPVPLDREDEIKIAAFQSLLAADPKRAIETLGELFKPDSKASDVFKQEALRVLRRLRISPTTNQNLSFSTGGKKLNKQFVPLLREILIKSFQSETSVKIRREIVFALAAIGDDQSADELARLYEAETNQEIKKVIIRSFGSSPNGFSTAYAYNPGVYTSSVSVSADKNQKKGFDKLLEIVRAEKDIELRRLAFSNLQRFAEWSTREGIIEMFSQMYDAESDEQFKISIIHSFAGSKQNQATLKLLDIAKKDKSDKLRLEAIRSLGNSTNPEVLKFLEDLIK